jgi:hypothetical protein
VQRVVERAHIGIDLVVQRAGQEAEPLARLDGWPGQDDAVDLFGLEGLHGLGHRQVRLAGARRSDAEHHRVGVDGVHVPLLVQGLGPDRLAARGQDVLGQDLGGTRVRVGGHADDALHRVRRQALPGTDDGDEFGQHLGGPSHGVGRACEGDLVAPHVDVGVQMRLEGAQELVSGADESDHRDRRGDGHLADGLTAGLNLG